MRMIAYVSHGSLLQHLHTISSYLFTCLLSEASLGSMKSAKPIVLLLSISRLLPTDAHICDGHCYRVRNPKYLTYFKTLVVVRVKVGRQVTTTMSDRVKLIKTVKESEMRLKGIYYFRS